MRFVALKSANQQAAAVVFRTWDLLVCQRTQAINALRGHLAEFGVIAAKGPVHTAKLIAALQDPAAALPQAARVILAVLVEELRSLDERVAVLDREIARHAKTSKMGERTLRRLLIIGASAVARWAARKGVPAGSWLGRMLARKPAMLVRVALANTMARIVWALLARGGVYRAPVAAV